MPTIDSLKKEINSLKKENKELNSKINNLKKNQNKLTEKVLILKDELNIEFEEEKNIKKLI